MSTRFIVAFVSLAFLVETKLKKPSFPPSTLFLSGPKVPVWRDHNSTIRSRMPAKRSRSILRTHPTHAEAQALAVDDDQLLSETTQDRSDQLQEINEYDSDDEMMNKT